MSQGIIVGIAIAIVAYAIYKFVYRLVTIHKVKVLAREFDEFSKKMEPIEVNLKEVLDRKFGPMLEERNRILAEQEKANKRNEL